MRTDHTDGQEAGAKRVYFACSAAGWYPNVYGIDMPAANELIAHDRSVEQVAKRLAQIGWCIKTRGSIECSREGNPKWMGSNPRSSTAAMAGDIDEQYLQSIQAARRWCQG